MCWYQGMDNKRRVLIVAYDGAQILDIACPSGALDIANRYGAEPPYSIELGTLGRRGARSSAGIVMGAGQGGSPSSVSRRVGDRSPRCWRWTVRPGSSAGRDRDSHRRR
jgi:transcriptional regulator GlxA family with amidase domain